MKMKSKGKEKYVNIYDNRNSFSLQQKKAVLVAFRISKLKTKRVKEFRTLETDRELYY